MGENPAAPGEANEQVTVAEEKPSGATQPKSKPNSKSIILFSDGTGNSSGKLFKTNVFRLYEAVDLGPAPAGRQRQIAFYDDGVGTSAFRPIRMLQGIFGFGLKRNVLEIYSYACRNYDPDSQPLPGNGVTEPGDHIYGFGFSRGAFTMRLVVGLIADQGIIPYTTDEDLEWKVRAAWRRFRRKWPRSIERVLKWAGVRRDPPPIAADALKSARGRIPTKANRQEEPPRVYDPSLNHRPIIRFVGVWDTVAAYGGPIAEITRAIDNFIYRLSMPNYKLSPRVRRACHALALDDERDSFQPLLWDELAENDFRTRYTRDQAPWLHEDRLQQVWFAGMHADVGGGYPDESLSYVSLLWMLEEAHKSGLRTVDFITDRYHGLANSFGPIHNSRAGMAGYYRYQPRRIDAWMDGEATRTLSLRDPAIRDEAGRQKGLVQDVRVHASVIARIASGTDGYAPIVLPADFSVVPTGGMAETKLLDTTGGRPPLTAEQIAEARRRPPPLVPAPVLDLLNRPDAKANIADHLEPVWDLVWRRRLVYFLTVLATILLLALPWWVPRELERLAGGDVGLWELPLIEAVGDAIGNLLRMVGEVLPGFVQRWIRAWAENPYWFLVFLTLTIIAMRHGKRLERRITDFSRATWHKAVPRIPPSTAGAEPEGFRDRANSWLSGSRNSLAYQRGIQLFKWMLLPNLVFAPLMLGAIFWFLHAVVLQLALPFVEAGSFCKASTQAPQIAEVQSDFSTSATCNPANGSVAAGESYTISFDVTEDWSDGDYETTPAGLPAGDMRWGKGYLGAAMRRAIGSAYLQPIAAVRVQGEGDGFRFVRLRPLEMVPTEEDPTRYQATFEAPATGELFLFANDAVLLSDIDRFYANNAGKARVTVLWDAHAAALAAAAAAVSPSPSPPRPAPPAPPPPPPPG